MQKEQKIQLRKINMFCLLIELNLECMFDAYCFSLTPNICCINSCLPDYNTSLFFFRSIFRCLRADKRGDKKWNKTGPMKIVDPYSCFMVATCNAQIDKAHLEFHK